MNDVLIIPQYSARSLRFMEDCIVVHDWVRIHEDKTISYELSKRGASVTQDFVGVQILSFKRRAAYFSQFILRGTMGEDPFFNFLKFYKSTTDPVFSRFIEHKKETFMDADPYEDYEDKMINVKTKTEDGKIEVHKEKVSVPYPCERRQTFTVNYIEIREPLITYIESTYPPSEERDATLTELKAEFRRLNADGLELAEYCKQKAKYLSTLDLDNFIEEGNKKYMEKYMEKTGGNEMARLKKLDNETQMQLVCVYLTQQLGTSTPESIRDVMRGKMGLDANIVQIKNALVAAKKRGLLSLNHRQNGETGDIEDAYSMKDLRFANPPEVAHVKNILPVLLNDPSTSAMFSELESEHTEGEKKGGRLPDIRDFITYKVTFKNVLPLLGGQPVMDNIKELEDETPKRVNKCGLRYVNGKVWIPGNLWLKASIKSLLRVWNIQDSKAQYLHINDLFFEPKQKPIQVITMAPGMKGKGGGGFTTCEALQPGEVLEFLICFPTTGGITIDQMRAILSSGMLHIGAKHKDYGLLELVSFEPCSS